MINECAIKITMIMFFDNDDDVEQRIMMGLGLKGESKIAYCVSNGCAHF